jgi:Peptidase family M3
LEKLLLLVTSESATNTKSTPTTPTATKRIPSLSYFGFTDKQAIDDDGTILAARSVVRQYKHETGCHLSKDDDRHDKTNKKSAYQQFQELSAALKELLISIKRQSSSESPSPQRLVDDINNVIGIKTKQAKLLGYPHFAAQMLDFSTVGTVNNVDRLLAEVAERVRPHVTHATNTRDATTSKEKGKGNSFMDFLSQAASIAVNGREPSLLTSDEMDEDDMLRLEDHVTLDGALKFCFRLGQDLLGVVIEEDPEPRGWHKDVRLFHAYDGMNSDSDSNDNDPHVKTNHQQHHLGSFYIDPFLHSGKKYECFVAPLTVRRRHNPPVWGDTEALLHELGHVYHFLLTESGPDNLPLDFTEFLPLVNFCCWSRMNEL